MNTSCHAHTYVVPLLPASPTPTPTCRRVMSHTHIHCVSITCITHTHMQTSHVTHVPQSCHTHVYIPSLTPASPTPTPLTTHDPDLEPHPAKESRHTYERVMSHTPVRHVPITCVTISRPRIHICGPIPLSILTDIAKLTQGVPVSHTHS